MCYTEDEKISELTALIVVDLFNQSEVLGRRVEVTGDDVPSDATLCEMIETCIATGDGVRCLVRGRVGECEANGFGCCRHGGHEHERVDDRDLNGVLERGVALPLKHLHGGEHDRLSAPECNDRRSESQGTHVVGAENVRDAAEFESGERRSGIESLLQLTTHCGTFHAREVEPSRSSTCRRSV